MSLSKIESSLMLVGISLCLLIFPASTISQTPQLNLNPDSVFHAPTGDDMMWEPNGTVTIGAQGITFLIKFNISKFLVYVYTIDHAGNVGSYKMGSAGHSYFKYGFSQEGNYWTGFQGNAIAFLFNGQLWYYINQLESGTWYDPAKDSYDCFARIPIPNTGEPKTYFDPITGTPSVYKKGAFQHDSTLYFLGTYANSGEWCLQRYTYDKVQDKFIYSTTISIQGDIPGDHFGGIIEHVDASGTHKLILNTYDRSTGDICVGWLEYYGSGDQPFWSYLEEAVVTNGSASVLLGGSIKGCRTPDQVTDSFWPERFAIFVVHGGHTMTYHEYIFQEPGGFIYKANEGSIVLPSSLTPYAAKDGAYYIQGAQELYPVMFHDNVHGSPDGFRQENWVYYVHETYDICGARFLSDSWQFIPDSTVMSLDLTDDVLYGPEIKGLWTLTGIVDGGPPCSINWPVWMDGANHDPSDLPTSLIFDYTTSSKSEVTSTSEDQYTSGANFNTDFDNFNFGFEAKYSDSFKNAVSKSTTVTSGITTTYKLSEAGQGYGTYIYSVPSITRYTYMVFPWWDTGLDYPVPNSVQFRYVVTGITLWDEVHELSEFPFLIEDPNNVTLNDWRPAGRTDMFDAVKNSGLNPACLPTWNSPFNGKDFYFETITDSTSQYEHTTSYNLAANFSGTKPDVFKAGVSIGGQVSFSTSTLNESKISSKLTVSLKNLSSASLGVNFSHLALQAYLFNPEEYDWWYLDSMGTERPWYVGYLVTTANQEIFLASPGINEKADEKGKLFSWYAKGFVPREYTLIFSTSPHISPTTIIMKLDAGKATDYYLPGFPKGYDKIYWAVRGITQDDEFVWSESRPLIFGNEEETDLPVWTLTAVPYPNPGDGQGMHLLIDTKEKGSVTVRIFSVNGTTVYKSVLNHPVEGPQRYELPQMALSRGIYILDVTINNERAVKKLTVF